MRKYVNTILRGVILAQIFIISSCNMLHDDLSECDLFLKFRYDYNLSYEDWFSQQVEEVKVFIFDSNGKYVKTLFETAPTISDPNYRMKIPYEMKGYTAIVWAGKTDQDYLLPKMVVGDPIEKLTLNYQPNNSISSHQIASLWHSGPHIFAFSDSGDREQIVSLIRNTNDFHIGVYLNETDVESSSNFEIKLIGANGSYDHNNNFIKGIPNITYRPAANSTPKASNLYTLRLVQGTPLLFSAKEISSGKYLLIDGKTEIDIVGLLLKGKPEGMTEQEYLDRKYIWDISLDYNISSFMAISITIDGWTYWFHRTDL